MLEKQERHKFAILFKKYRLRSEIETLSEFGDLLAEEGVIYDTSLFTRWQQGSRLPKNRYILLKIINVFLKKRGFQNLSEINTFLESTGQGYLTNLERLNIKKYLR